MDMNKFHFRGNNRFIIILPRSAAAPAGFKLASSGSLQDARSLVREISPHLASDINALGHACSLLKKLGITITPNARAVAPKLSETLSRGLLSIYTEEEKPLLYHSSEMNTGKASKAGGASASKGKTPVTSQGMQDASSTQTGTSSNDTATEVPIAEQECRSDPVSMLSGEEILPLIDFELSGVMPLSWRRLYRSGKTDVNLGLGYGWRHNFSLQLAEQYQPPPKVGPKKAGKHWLELTDEEGAVHVFEQVKRGQTSVQLSSGLSLFYQGDGRQVLIKPDDSHWTFVKQQSEHGEHWLLETISNYHGQYLSLYYDVNNRLVRIACSPKRGIVLQYNHDNNILRIGAYVITKGDKGDENDKQQLQPGLLASYQYDDTQALIAATNSQGEVERYAYFDGYLLKRRTRASGFSHHFLWQNDGQTDGQNEEQSEAKTEGQASSAKRAKCIKQWGDNNTYLYTFSYDGDITTSTDSLGNVEQFTHNKQGLLTRYIDANGQQTFHEYDQYGRKTRQTDALDNHTQYSYNPKGQLSGVITPDGALTQYYYNALGKRVLTVDAQGQHFKRQFDGTGRLLAELAPDGRSSRYQYTDLGQLKQKIAADGVVSLYHWDKNGELLALQVGENLTRYSYDNLGRLNATVDAMGLVTQFSRNERGQVIKQISYGQAEPEYKIVKSFAYDDAGRLLSQYEGLEPEQRPELGSKPEQGSAGLNAAPDTAPEAGIESRYDYDGLAQPTKKTFADGSYLNYQYDQERNLTAITRSDGASYHIDYSPSEQPIKLTGFDGREQCYGYDGNDKLISVSDSNERFIRLKRDNMGRIIEQSSVLAPQQKPALAQSNTNNFYQYDKLGRLVRAHNSERTVQLSYVAKGVGTGQLHQTQQGSWSLDYTYHCKGSGNGNGNGQRESLILPDGSALHYGYDQHGQLSELAYSTQDGEAKQTKQLVKRNYSKAGLLVQQEHGNGMILHQQYDAFSRLTSQHWQGDNSSGHSFNDKKSYHYDHQHQLINKQQIVSGSAESLATEKNSDFAYDKLSQLLKASSCDVTDNEARSTSYQWDAFGNPIDKTATSGSTEVQVKHDRLLSFDGSDYRYDGSGNQISSLAKGNKQTRSFDGLNQLRQINVNDQLAQYQYDALGRRSAKITEQGRIDFIWDGNQLIGEHHQGLYTWYIYLPESFLPIALIKNGEIYYYHLDQLGTPVCLTDKNGAQVWREQADVFGASQEDSLINSQNQESPNQVENPLRFQGQYFDTESGLHYNRFRYYCPKQGRFIHQDPIGLLGGINPYSYTLNPVNWVDPFGLNCKEGNAARKLPTQTPQPKPMPTNVPKDVMGPAANDAQYKQAPQLLKLVAPLARAATLVGALVYSPELGGGLEVITAPDGTVYSKHADELIYNATASNGETWSTRSPQDDMQFRMFQANGGDGSMADWIAQGKPDGVNSQALEKPKTGPGSDEHRAERWNDYQKRGGEWTKERWDKQYDVNMQQAKKSHQAVADYSEKHELTKEDGWDTEKTLEDAHGNKRRLDIVNSETFEAIEHKRGQQYLSKDNLSEIERDAALRENTDWDIRWHFDDHASKPLLNKLDEMGIPWTLGD